MKKYIVGLCAIVALISLTPGVRAQSLSAVPSTLGATSTGINNNEASSSATSVNLENNVSAKCTVNGHEVPCSEVGQKAFGFLKAGIGFLIAALIFLTAGLIFWIVTIIHAASNPIPSKGLWLAVIILAGVIGSIVYYFVVMRSFNKPAEKQTEQPQAPLVVPVSTPATTKYAGFWIRVLASIIDSMIVGGVIGLLNNMLPDYDASKLLINIITIIGAWLYASLLTSSSRQGTLGKMMLGLKVVDYNYQRISFGRATARHFSQYLSGMILMAGFIMVAFTEKKQGLHDIIAETLVVRNS
ncbi:MAG: RDD family protein [bacterium]